jgi:DNA-binding MarR family transcriptional regulator
MYEELISVIDEARLMIHRSVAVVEQLHEGTGVSVPMRAVLEFLRRNGDHTVSAIARTRGVSRQHIQIIVNDLADAGLVDRLDNPHHRRAPLIALTVQGESAIDAMHSAERSLLEPAFAEVAAITTQRLAVAHEVLRAISTTFDQLSEHREST